MRAVFLLGLFMSLVVASSAQTVLLPTWVADSLIYEAKLSRQCSQVMKAQALEIESLGKELAHTNKALSLSQSESKTLESLVSNAKESSEILAKQFAIDLGKEKRKKRKWVKVALVQTVVIVVLILTPDI